jgi:tetratricopeptide (TPR) repeat protein
MKSMHRAVRFRLLLVAIHILAFSIALGGFDNASAQFAIVDSSQSDLIRKPASEQAEILAGIVRGTGQKWICAHATASLERTYDGGSAGWLVICDQGRDYWVLMPAKPKMAATAVPCALARATAGADCYATLHTVRPEDIEQCKPPEAFPDPVIRSCTAILQSGKYDDNPELIFAATLPRALAYAQYRLFDIALLDFDRAVALRPNDFNAVYNRAVALERAGKYDQALLDLDRSDRLKPNDLNVLYERGYTYMKKGDNDRAIADLDEVLRLNPGFEKAARDRAAALKAKEAQKSTPPDDPGQQHRGDDASVPYVVADLNSMEPERQAAYCMEASFGYVQQLTKLVPLLREARTKAQGMLDQTTLSPADKTALLNHIKSLDADTEASQANRTHWDTDLKVYLAYLTSRNLVTSNASMMASQSVRKDQEAVQDIYRACLRACVTPDNACRKTCNEKADGSDASRRMLRCREIVGNFK